MIDLENKAEDIIDIFVSSLRKIEKTIGLIADKELVEYVMECIFSNCYTSAKYIDLTGNEDIEHIIYVEADGSVTVFPIEKYADIDTVNTVYIDMDGAVNQDIVNYCVNEDKEVILFGQADEDDECDGDCENCNCHDEISTTTSYEVNRKAIDKETYEKAIEDIEDIEEKYLDGVRDMFLRYCEIQDEMNEWRKLLN